MKTQRTNLNTNQCSERYLQDRQRSVDSAHTVSAASCCDSYSDKVCDTGPEPNEGRLL